MSSNVSQCRPNIFFSGGGCLLSFEFSVLRFWCTCKNSLVRIGVLRSPGVLTDGACNCSVIHVGHECTRRAASSPVKSGQVRSSPVKSGQVGSDRIFPAIGDGKRGRLLAADSGRPDSSSRGSCVSRSWFSVYRLPLPWLVVVDASVAHVKTFCSGNSFLSSIFFIRRSFWRSFKVCGLGSGASVGVTCGGQVSTIAGAAGFCTRHEFLGQLSLFVLGSSRGLF